ncbi:Pentatricopeptide repeat-containing protein [Quillaja saponaria]|uniref:Pentatricopeptide repeat-containing protein n=1 Tax=Quillaja saponaria TaxID=32244 RepID=A0AAD7PR66_QUISA|nr:Pentatricopeptide repeat-containing protein [Quillaja saponaria]
MKPKLIFIGEQGNYVFNHNLKIIHLGKSGRVEEASRIFSKMTQRNTVTYNSMISVFAKNGRLDDARHLFDIMPQRNLVSWNTMIAGYLHNNRVEEAQNFFDKMSKRDAFSWTLMITCYTRKGELEKAREMFDLVPNRSDTACWNAMIAGYAKKVGDLDSAWKFFERIPDPNVVSWVTMICGFARHGKIAEARRLFDQMPSRNVVSWNAMIAAYVQHLQIDEAVRLFMEMPEKDSVSWTTIINGYVRVGKLDKAQEVINQMPCKNIAAQTAMCGRMDEALNLFREMDNKDMVSWNTMISGYAQVGKMDRALKIFEEMRERNIVSWNSLITGFIQNGLYLHALESLILMGREGKKFDESTFACGFSACASLAALQVGKQLHGLILKNGYVNDLFVSNSLIAMYAKCGRVFSAEHVFRNIDDCVDLVSWNSLISGFALNGYAKEAIKVFEEMLTEGMTPDKVSFIGILSACSHAGLIDQGFKWFKCMIEVYAIEPVAEHYSCMVDLLSRMGKLEEAFEIVKKMNFKANAGLWGSLLGACRIHRNLELGRFAAERLLELEPHNASHYIILSNMHAEAGRWKEVERVRVLMRENKAGKQPGCSWVERRNQLHSFLSDDPAQLRTANIHIISKTLTAHMKSTCQVSDINSAFFDIL